MPDNTESSTEVKLPTKAELLGAIEADERAAGEQEDSDDSVDGQSAQEHDPVEQEARASGWVPKEEFKGNKANWRPADQWVDRGRFFSTISTLRSELNQTKSQVADAYNQGKAVAAVQFQEKINELKAMRRAALTDQNIDAVEKIETAIDQTKARMEQVQKPQGAANIPREYWLFEERNPWYLNKRSREHNLANAIMKEFVDAHPNARPADLFWHVETEMMKEKPELFGGQKPQTKAEFEAEARRMPASESGGSQGNRESASGGNSSLQTLKRNMNEEERRIMKTLIQTKTFKNEEAYLKEYALVANRGRR